MFSIVETMVYYIAPCYLRYFMHTHTHTHTHICVDVQGHGGQMRQQQAGGGAWQGKHRRPVQGR